MNKPPELGDVLGTMSRYGYNVHSDGQRQLIGIRTAATIGDKFDDWLCLLYSEQDNWVWSAFPGTTDPGTYYRENPMHVEGTAVLKPAQYPSMFRLGLHRNTYAAFKQATPVTVYRDANRDAVIDTVGMELDTGMFGINLHHASAYEASQTVGRWSAGCQVLQAQNHLRYFLNACRARKEQKYYDYTLLTIYQFKK